MSAVQASPEHQIAWALLQLAGHGTPDRIAAHLHTLGIRGTHTSRTCLITQYLHQQTGLHVAVWHRWWRIDGKQELWSMVQPVTDFIAAFARDQDPELLAHLDQEGAHQ